MVTQGEVKAFMSKAYYISKRLNVIYERMYEYRAKAAKQTSDWSDTPGGGKATSSPQAVWVERYMLEQQRLEGEIRNLQKQEDLIRDVMWLISDPQVKSVAEDYHLYRLGIRNISLKYSYSERQIYRMLNKAYWEITNKLNRDPELEDAFREYEDIVKLKSQRCQ